MNKVAKIPSLHSYNFDLSRISDLGVLIISIEGKIININNYALTLLGIDEQEWPHITIPKDFKKILLDKGVKINTLPYPYHNDSNGKMYILQDMREKNGLRKKIEQLQMEKDQLQKRIAQLTKENSYLLNTKLDLQAIFDSSYDVIYVSDKKGKTLRVSSACKRLWGLSEEELIGKNVYDLEKEGIFSPSITRMVLEQKKKIEAFQTTRNGRRLYVLGNPIFDDKGQIVRVINASRDITEIDMLKQELENARLLSNKYQQELWELRNQNMLNDNIIYRSEKIKQIISFIKKIANVDSTVLLTGESGVGKEVFTKLLHKLSNRNEKPFIKINCGAIPEALLESELFGYEKGSFTGANKNGKLGLIELANEGTLFLDEIGELPFALQVKLLRVLQERELMRVGGLKPIQIDVRFVAATNRDLSEMVKDGKFREDLFYRLNIFPINIPPLRERREDIPALLFHFQEKYNRKYGMNKVFNHETVEVLTNYDWQGNVRELENVTERLIVTVESKTIEPNHLPLIFRYNTGSGDGVHISKIIPLDKAIEAIEKQLILSAYEKFKTTVKVAKVLGISQATASRKIKKYCGGSGGSDLS